MTMPVKKHTRDIAKQNPRQLYRFSAGKVLSSQEDLRLFVDCIAEDHETNFELRQSAVEAIALAIGMQMIVRTVGVAHADLDHAISATWHTSEFDQTLERVINAYRSSPHETKVL